jgi:hypothetical protein
MIIPKKIHSKVNYSAWWLKKLHVQSIGSPLPPHSLIFEKFEKSMASPDMTPEPRSWHIFIGVYFIYIHHMD